MLEKKASELIDQLTAGLGKYGPDAIAALSRAIRVEAIAAVVGSLLVLVAAVWIMAAVRRWAWSEEAKYQEAKKADRFNAYMTDTSIQYGLAIALVVVASIAFMIVWFDGSTWLALFDQRAYIAHEIMHKLMN